MNLSPKSKIALSLILSLTLVATGCTAQWISVALANLPVLTQMALNIATVVTTLQSGNQLSASDAAAIQNISTQASQDLNLLHSLYNQYKSDPASGTLQEIQNAIADIDQDLPALLQAAHISDPVLSSRISAAVSLILTTVDTFAALIPQSSAPVTARMARSMSSAKLSPPHAKELKKEWNQQVCAPSGKPAFDAAFSLCVIH